VANSETLFTAVWQSGVFIFFSAENLKLKWGETL
jgi:hypothetical protein